jgi:hypothetical protein
LYLKNRYTIFLKRCLSGSRIFDLFSGAGSTYSRSVVHHLKSHARPPQYMAVSVQTPLHSKLGMWNSGNSQTTFSGTGSDAVPSMAYQYPLPSSGTDPSTNMISSYHPLPVDHSQPNSPALVKPSSPAIRNRGAGGASKSAKIKRSMSTPNVRGQATADAAALALSAEKRRNKLGYHRTSVACGEQRLD